MYLTYRYRLLPTKRQHRALESILEDQRQLYNAALEERIDCYRKTGRNLSYVDQFNSLVICRRTIPEMAETPSNLQRWTLAQVDESFKGFFNRLKINGQKAGFPRFRSISRWKSFGFAEIGGCRFDGKRLRFKRLPSGIKVHLHRPLNWSLVKALAITKDKVGGWFVSFNLKIDSNHKKIVETAIGIDLGLKVFAYCSDGVIIPNPRIARRAEAKIKKRHKAFARCIRGSAREEKVRVTIARAYRKVVNIRRTWLHQQSRTLVNRSDLIAIESLSVDKMARSPRFSKSIYDASWSTFIAMLRYKAERAGTHLVEVNPKYTSQDCSQCGQRVPKTLWERIHSCPKCGIILDRDHNAALNVLHAAVVGREVDNVAQLSGRRPGNISLISG